MYSLLFSYQILMRKERCARRKCSTFRHEDLCPGAVVRVLVMTQNKEHQLETSHVSSILSLVIMGCLWMCLFTRFRRWQCSASCPVPLLWVIKIYSLPLLSHSECLEELPLDGLVSWWKAKLRVINICHSWCSTPTLSFILHSHLPWHFCCDSTPAASPDYWELPPSLGHLTGLQWLLGDPGLPLPLLRALVISTYTAISNVGEKTLVWRGAEQHSQKTWAALTKTNSSQWLYWKSQI